MIYFHLPYKLSLSRALQSFMLANQAVLLQRGLLYPSTCLLGAAHDVLGKAESVSELDEVKILIQRCVEFKENRPQGKILLSSPALFSFSFERMYDLISGFSQISDFHFIVTLCKQETYLEHLWKAMEVKPRIHITRWMEDRVENLAHLHYDRAVAKLESLVNQDRIEVINVSNRDSHQLIKMFLEKFHVFNRTAMDFGEPPVSFETTIHLPKTLVSLLGPGNRYLSEKYLKDNPLTF